MTASDTQPAESKPKRRWFQYGLTTLLGGVTLCVLVLSVWASWDYLPGTFRHDANGFPHGTGVARYFYSTGELQIEERYCNGLITSTTWYRRDKSVIDSCTYDRERGGVGYYLRDDGTIKVKMQYKYSPSARDYVADGVAEYYNPDGSVSRTVVFRDGHEP